MMIHKFFLEPIFIASFLILVSSSSASAQVSLVRDGEPNAAIVIAETPTETARYAAEELARHLEKATGAAVEIVSETEEPIEPHTRVFIGETKAAKSVGIEVDKLPRETFVLRTVGNDLFIVGKEGNGDPLSERNPDVGTLFGVYEFLDRYLEVRWLWPGELGTYVPQKDSVELWAVNDTVAPALRFRAMVWGLIRSAARGKNGMDEPHRQFGFSQEGAQVYADALEVYLRRHRMGGMDVKPRSGHAFSGWWQKYGEEHPEWFALRKDGTRGDPDREEHNVPMCVSNPELHDFIVEQWDGESDLLLGPVDRPGRCLCENCLAWDGPQPDPPPWFAERLYKSDRRSQELFSGATSDRYARFWKTIQEKAAKRNPHVLVSGSFLYENEFPAPVTGIELNRNIYGEFVQWLDPHLRYFPMPDEAYDWIKEQWMGWRGTGIRMAYRPNYLHDGYVLPHFETQQSGEFFKFAYDRGMEGARFDSLTGQWANQGLRLYLHFRLMTDPKLELEDIRAEYLSAFGPAAGAMDRYFAYWEDYAFENRMRIIDLFWDIGWRYREYVKAAHLAFPPACFEPAEKILDEALSLAEKDALPEYADRVRFIGLGLKHAQLATQLTALYDGEEEISPDRREEAKQALETLVQFRKENENTFFSDLYHVTWYWELNRLDFEELMGEKPEG